MTKSQVKAIRQYFNDLQSQPGNQNVVKRVHIKQSGVLGASAKSKNIQLYVKYKRVRFGGYDLRIKPCKTECYVINPRGSFSIIGGW
jgi:hypothetical protein